MSEPHSSRLHSALPLPPLFTEALLCQEQGSTERKEGSPFSFFVLRIAIQALPKPPLMSWPPQCCERREKEAGLGERKGLINTGSFSSLMERQACVH